MPDNYVSRRKRPQLFAVPRGRTNLLGKAPITRALHTLNNVAKQIDLFTCSLSEFRNITINLMYCVISKDHTVALGLPVRIVMFVYKRLELDLPNNKYPIY